MRINYGPVIVEGYALDQAGSTIQHIIDALENVVYDSDAWNTDNRDMTKVRITIELTDD